MKIAFIVSRFPVLSETFILNQITGLIDRGHEVDIYANNEQKEPRTHSDIEKYDLLSRTYYRHMPANKVWRVIKAIGLIISNFYKNPIVILKSLNPFKYGKKALSLELLYATIPFLGKDSYDIIHCHFGPNGNIGVLLKDLGIQSKVLTSFYGFDMSSYVQRQGSGVYESLFQHGDFFTVLSNHMKKRLVGLGCSENKILIHPLGIDPRKFKMTRSKRADDRIRILTVARLTKKKGLKYSVKAVSKLAKRYPDITYQIVGDGPLRKRLEKLIRNLEISDQVKLLGWRTREQVIELYRQSDIFLLASVTATNGDQEGTPTVLLEAQAHKLPIVSTLHAGIPEITRNGESGFLVPERDVDALAERLEYLIEHPEIWPEMGRAGRRFVEEHYDINKLNDRLVEIYQKLLDGELP